MKIIDSHCHLWDLAANSYPWLQSERKRYFFGDLTPICRNYLLADLDRDIADLDVEKIVHVQANWDPSHPVGETRWLHQLSQGDARGRPNAIVAYVDLAAEDAAAVLEGHCEFPALRGIRQVLYHRAEDPAKPDLMASALWRENLARLGPLGLSFDMMVFPRQMEHAAEVVRTTPEVTFMIEHTGCPALSDAAMMTAWRDGMAAFAKLPNTVAKISGLGMFDPNWNATRSRDVVLHVIDCFGPDRCMFGSNFPVDSLMTSYHHIWDTFADITSGFTDSEKDALFRGSAEKWYRI